MQRTLLILIAITLVVGGGAFFGGMKYGQRRVSGGFSRQDFQNLRNLPREERQQRLQQVGLGGNGSRDGSRGGTGNDFASGEIIAKDEKSITVKLRDGGSKIIFYSGNAQISKTVEGTVKDLDVGKSVVVNGKASEDGTINAQSIQLRSSMEPRS